MKRTGWAVLLAGALALSLPVDAQDTFVNRDEGDDPEHGVARLSLLNGDVTVQRGDSGEVVAGELNAPVVELDHVLTGVGSRAEIQFDWANMVRLGPVSDVGIGELRTGDYLLQVAEGTVTFRVLRESDANVEISTPTVSVRPTEKGIYRITVRPDGATEITVRSGQAEIFTPRGSEILHSGKTMQARGRPSDPEYVIRSAIPRDDWDNWNDDRDRDLERSESYMYTSRSISGAEDLDAYGRWVYDSPYGYVWVPNVTASWAPYRVGRWTWVNYYGWTWVSGDPWGWAPYHYGNWYSSPYGWAWFPGEVRSSYYWKPALVLFFGWGNVSVGVSISAGTNWGYANIGWVPLAPYEVYQPWYGGYGNTTIVNVTSVNIVNVYRNARQFNGRNGVTCVPSTDFGRGRVTQDNFVRATNADLVRAGSVKGRVPLETTRESRRFSDRTPALDTAVRADRRQNRELATRTSVTTDRSRREATMTGAPAPGAPVTTGGPGNRNDRDTQRTGVTTDRVPPPAGDRGRREAAVTAPAAPGNAAGDEFKRFEGGPPTRDTSREPVRATPSTRSTLEPRSTSNGDTTTGFRRAETVPAPVDDRSRRPATQPAPTYQPPPTRTEQPAPRTEPPATRYEPPVTRTPVEINRPIVEERGRRSEPVPQPRNEPEPPRREPAPAPRQEVRSAAPAPATPAPTPVATPAPAPPPTPVQAPPPTPAQSRASEPAPTGGGRREGGDTGGDSSGGGRRR
jgi:hypothetical protein